MINALIKLIFTIGFMSSFSFSVQAKLSETFEKSFAVEENCELCLDNINGSVDLYGWDQQCIKIEATIKYDNQKERDRIKIYTSQHDNKVCVETCNTSTSADCWFPDYSSVNVCYVVNVPTDVQLSPIKLVNGNAYIRGVHGKISACLTNGNIKIVYDKLNPSCSSINIKTINGNIQLFLPEISDISLYAHSINGNIANSFGLNSDMLKGKTLKFEIGSGEIKVDLKAVNGNINILKYVESL